MTWLLAFTVHSTLWFGLAWLWIRLRPGMHVRLADTPRYLGQLQQIRAQATRLQRTRRLLRAALEVSTNEQDRDPAHTSGSFSNPQKR